MATPTFDDPIIVSSNRFDDLHPYCARLYNSDPSTWCDIWPWEFPQHASKEVEQAFLRRFFSDREIHVQGGDEAGFRFLKQVWYCIAEENAFHRVPLAVDDWFNSATYQSIAGNAEMIQWALSPAATVSTFFGNEERELYGEKFLTLAVGCIQDRLTWPAVQDSEPINQASTSNSQLEVPVTSPVVPTTSSPVSAPESEVTNHFEDRSPLTGNLTVQELTSPTPVQQDQDEPATTAPTVETSPTPSDPAEPRIPTPVVNLPPAEKDADQDFHLIGSAKYFPHVGNGPTNPPQPRNADYRNASHHNLPPAPPGHNLPPCPPAGYDMHNINEAAMMNGMHHVSLHPHRLEPTLPRLSGAHPGTPQARIMSDPTSSHMRPPHAGAMFNPQQFMPSPVLHPAPHVHAPLQQVRQYGQHQVAPPQVPHYHQPHHQPVPSHHPWNGMPSGDVRNSLPQGQRVFSNDQYQPTEIYMLKRDQRPDTTLPRGGGRPRGVSNGRRGKSTRQPSQTNPMAGNWTMHGQNPNHNQGFPHDVPYYQQRGPQNDNWRQAPPSENFYPTAVQHVQHQNHVALAQPSPLMNVGSSIPPSIDFQQMQGVAPHFEPPSATRLRPDRPAFEPGNNKPTQVSITEDCTHVKKLVVFDVDKNTQAEDIHRYFEEVIGGVQQAWSKPGKFGGSVWFVGFQSHMSVKMALDRVRERSLPAFHGRHWKIEVPREYWDTTHYNYPSHQPGRAGPKPSFSPGQTQQPAPNNLKSLPQFGDISQHVVQHNGVPDICTSAGGAWTEPVESANTPATSSPKKSKKSNKKTGRKKSQQTSQPVSYASSQADVTTAVEQPVELRPSTTLQANEPVKQTAVQQEPMAGQAEQAPAQLLNEDANLVTSSVVHDEEALDAASLGHLNEDEPFRAPKTSEEKTATSLETDAQLNVTWSLPNQDNADAIDSSADAKATEEVDTAEHIATEPTLNPVTSAGTGALNLGVDLSSPQSNKSNKDSRKVPLPLKPISMNKSSEGTPRRNATQEVQSPRVVSDASTVAASPKFHTAPSTPSTVSHPVELTDTKASTKVDERDKQESKASQDLKKQDKQKGPAQTESFSMFSKKEKPGAKKNQKKHKKGDTLKGKPKDFDLLAEASKQGGARADVDTGLASVSAKSDDTATNVQRDPSLEQADSQTVPSLPDATASEQVNGEPIGGNAEFRDEDGADVLTMGKINDVPKVNSEDGPILEDETPQPPPVTSNATDNSLTPSTTHDELELGHTDALAQDKSIPTIDNANSNDATSVRPPHRKNRKTKRKRNRSKKTTTHIDSPSHNHPSSHNNPPAPQHTVSSNRDIPNLDDQDTASDSSDAMAPASTQHRPSKKIAALKHHGPKAHLITQSPPHTGSFRIEHGEMDYGEMKQARQRSQEGAGREQMVFIVHSRGVNQDTSGDQDKSSEEASDSEDDKSSEESTDSTPSQEDENGADNNALRVFIFK